MRMQNFGLFVSLLVVVDVSTVVSLLVWRWLAPVSPQFISIVSSGYFNHTHAPRRS